MSAGFTQWESDPLFSAAEVVQDSADRMESIFRILLHEQSLFQGDSSDQKLLNSIEYHTRDLATALGTTKWQLEDFERAVDLSALSDNSRVKEGIIFRHKQFIRAIREQIIHVERGLEGPSSGVPEGNSQWLNLNDNDREGLVLFLTGGKFMDHAQSESGNSIMRRFLDPTKASTYDSKRDEIIELKTEEIEDSQGRHSCLGLSSGSCDVFKNTMQSCRVLAEYKKAFQRLWYIIQFNRFPVQIATLILILAVLGILMYRVAW